MKFTLLTHEKEQCRADNSGQLLHNIAELDSQSILWQRTQPNQALVQALLAGEAVLLTQSSEGEQLDNLDGIKHLVILDGTWQEARKIYNKSPYLKTAPWFALTEVPRSQYNLRRNQVDGGLCTAECAIEILKYTGDKALAEQLNQHFMEFLASDRRDQ